jgi:hypothetical protein
MGEAFHITTDELHPWDAIYCETAAALGARPPKLVHVATDTLVRYEPKWGGSLLADKTWSLIFDNSKVKSAVGEWECRHGLKETLAMSLPFVKARLEKFTPDAELERLLDRIVTDQSGAI